MTRVENIWETLKPIEFCCIDQRISSGRILSSMQHLSLQQQQQQQSEEETLCFSLLLQRLVVDAFKLPLILQTLSPQPKSRETAERLENVVKKKRLSRYSVFYHLDTV